MYNQLVVALLCSSSEMNGGTPICLVSVDDRPKWPSGNNNSRYTMINTPLRVRTVCESSTQTWRSTSRNDVESPSLVVGGQDEQAS